MERNDRRILRRSAQWQQINSSVNQTAGQSQPMTHSSATVFLDFICKLEGWKTRCKNLHWAAPKKNTHEYLDEFFGVLSNYQDGLAEGYMGILGKMAPDAIEGVKSASMTAQDLVEEVALGTYQFYENIPTGVEFKGIISECETFIQNIQKYKYLFSLCDR